MVQCKFNFECFSIVVLLLDKKVYPCLNCYFNVDLRTNYCAYPIMCCGRLLWVEAVYYVFNKI